MAADIFGFHRALDLLLSDPHVEYIVLYKKIIIRYDWAENYLDWELLKDSVDIGQILNGKWEVVFTKHREVN